MTVASGVGRGKLVADPVAFAGAKEAYAAIADGMRRRRLDAVDVGPEGHAITITVADVAGATGVEVAAATVTIGYGELLESVASVPVSGSGATRDVQVPDNRRLRSLTLRGMTPTGPRITVALPDEQHGGFGAPQFAHPEVARRGALPPSLRGATLDGEVLRLPDVKAPAVRLSVVDGAFPESFAALPFTLGSVSAQVLTGPLDLELVDPAGKVLWAFPGELADSGQDASVDIRVPLELALAAQAGNGEPLQARFVLRASEPCRAGLATPRPRITIVREEPGVLELTLAGEGAAPALQGGALAGEAPAAAFADLRIRYDGLRVLDAPRDELPAGGGEAAGAVVGSDAVTRALPPALFAEFAPARLALVGRAPVPCELSVWLARPGTLQPLCAPGVVAVQPDGEFALHWVALPDLTAPLPAAVVAARATSGRFLWAGAPAPGVRVVVADPDPGGRPLTIGGLALASCSEIDVRTLAAALPPAAFAGDVPRLESDLFLTVELGDLRLEYAR